MTDFYIILAGIIAIRNDNMCRVVGQKKSVRNRFTTCMSKYIICLHFITYLHQRRNLNLYYNGPGEVHINAARRYCSVVPKTKTLRARHSWRHWVGYRIIPIPIVIYICVYTFCRGPYYFYFSPQISIFSSGSPKDRTWRQYNISIMQQ